MGTSKRYADNIDQRVQARQEAATEPHSDPQHAARDWQPPWPPIRIGVGEWIIMRDSRTEPVGVIRVVKLGPRNETYYRVVTWAPDSADRQLLGYYESLYEADRAILFSPKNPVMPSRPNEGQ